MISLDLVIPTYNRPDLLAFTLASVAQANLPSDMALRVIVADNNSTPEKQKANKAAIAKSALANVVYLLESRQGRSWALNTGIQACTADYVGFVDDDEKIDANWLETIAVYLREGRIDYIGGPCKPDWAAQAPNWLPVHVGKYRGVLGWIEQSSTARPFDDFDGNLCGGNCVIRRSALLEVGSFSTMVGRSSNNLMVGEDDELQRKLRAHGKLGMYDPALIIYHLIPVQRMTRKYHIRWAFWSGVSNGVRLNWMPAEPVAKLFGLPRYRFSQGIYGLLRWMRKLLSPAEKAKAESFAGLLDTIYLCGTIYGKHFFRQPKDASKI
ncbi:glycosyltransferase [Undibacterium sp.]|jgi:glycosyltransferase involved in cell wall biosynthesis|uniref:glycosyltransferase n=1 Tax=Undibacterium sp. TaxID=1914977 RepID=UPI002C6FE211|nr:glycosyltransferase [Undibacterium sp.]HTD05645.1 glycosyltransferase [Undibacterium sp.]